MTNCSPGDGLKKQMKAFGGKHRDKKDSPGGMTLFFVFADVPLDKGYEGGRFHFPELGGYLILDEFLVIGFSGLHSHGGTPPRAPKGVKPDPRFIRFAVVLYPPTVISSGDAVYNFAVGGKGKKGKPEVVRLVPEYMDLRSEP